MAVDLPASWITNEEGEKAKGSKNGLSDSSSVSGSSDGGTHAQVLKDLYEQLTRSRKHARQYASLGGFLLFAAVYFAILYLQADSQTCYEISSSHYNLLPPGWTGNSPVSFPNAPYDLLGWINSSIIQTIWANPPCGDGVCATPAEYPSFGRFGCRADCGVLANLTSISVILSNEFSTEVARASSSWNLVMTAPVSLTWFATNQLFPDLVYSNNVTTLAVPDGNWVLILNAPYGGVVGVIEPYSANGTSHNNSMPVIALSSFGKCLPDQGLYAVCQEMSSVIAAYLVSTCEVGPLFNNTLALLRRDWSNLCKSEPEVVVKLLNFTGNYTPSYEYMSTIGVKPFSSRTVLQCACPTGAITKTVPPGSSCKALLSEFRPYNLTLEALNSTGVCGSSASTTLPTGTVVCINTGGQIQASSKLASTSALTASPTQSSSLTDFLTARDAATLWAVDGTPEVPLWEALGPTDETRNATLSVAVYRALSAFNSDACLTWFTAYRSSPHGIDNLYNWTALFIGGPRSGPVSFVYKKIPHAYLPPSEVQPGTYINSTIELAKEMFDAHLHSGHSLKGPDMIDRFLDILLAGFFSSFTLPTKTQVAFYNWFHHLDAAIVSSKDQTCDQPDYVLDWATGSTLSTRIRIPQNSRREASTLPYTIVQWVWTDDNPHSIQAFSYNQYGIDYYESFGVESAFLLGTGSASKVLSRNTMCTPANRYFDLKAPDALIPCALATPFQPAGTFSFSTGFGNHFSTVEYGSEGAADASNVGFLYMEASAPPPPSAASANSLDFSCSLDCNISKIGDGLCNAACNNAACLFDGGDCSCSRDASGRNQCPCPGNLTRAADDGSCCLGDAVGSSLTFGFHLQNHGPSVAASDAAFVAGTSTPVTRIVANANVVIIGLLISQKRAAVTFCDAQKRFTSLVSGFNCWGEESTSGWGIASPFLPGARLYNRTYASEQAAQQETAYATNSSLLTEAFNVNGSPLGFFIPTIQYADNSTRVLGKDYIFDINLDVNLATNHLQYIYDGYFYDGQTTSSSIQLVTYNALKQYFTLVKCDLTFQEGGKVVVKCSVDSARVGLYRSVGAKVRLALEIIFLVALALNVLLEVYEAYQVKVQTGKLLNYFANGWQYLDWLSMLLMTTCSVLWIYHVTTQARTFQTSLRYNIYRFLPGDYFRLLTPADTGDKSTSALPEALQVFSDLNTLINFRILYFAINGVNIQRQNTRTKHSAEV
eukprot:TRINITY_DN2455_c0_g1_i1.p1 TRINITY_DN2455_c0_g1~~TRINITY_DN2455_c0_g1_i1.p1  ORF type:complete len:1223 (-),score=139.73 TRINITY_DN2455_c0_g1_i1:88-3756(-)